MKKFTLLLVVLLMSAFIVGCDKDEDSSSSKNTNTTTVTAGVMGELKSYLEASENVSFFGKVSGGLETMALSVDVNGEHWRFLFAANKSSVTFDRNGAYTSYETVSALKTVLTQLKSTNAGYLTLNGTGYYKSSTEIVVNFNELDSEVTITLDEELTDGQNIVKFKYNGKSYTVQLINAFIDESLYKEANETTIEKIVQSKNSSVNLNGIKENIALPVKATIGGNDYTIVWASSNTDVITNEGKVIRPESTVGDATVTLTATLTYENVAASSLARSASIVAAANEVSIEVTVLKKPAIQNGYYLELSVANQPIDLVADGITVMEVTGYIKNADGLVESYAGNAQFLSDYGLTAAQEEAAFESGKVNFKVTLPEGISTIEDTLSFTITKDTTGLGINNLTSDKLPVTYLPSSVDGGADEDSTYVYNIADVTSYNVADRVLVKVGGVNPNHLEAVKADILDQVKVYNDVTGAPIDLVEIVNQAIISYDEETGYPSYSFEVLTKLPEYSTDKTTYENDKDEILNDNQKNFWGVDAATTDGAITLGENKVNTANYFTLQDENAPSLSKVIAFTDDINYLPSDSIIAVYDKPVNRLTAENASYYTLNGKVLNGEKTIKDINGNITEVIPYVSYIRVLDKESQESEFGKKLLAYNGIKEIVESDEYEERSVVVIQLSRRFARSNLLDKSEGNNLLQIKNISDWAGMTDLTDNNRISTQDMSFSYVKPEGKTSVKITRESAEQYVVVLEGVYRDQEDTEEIELTADDLETNLFETESTTTGGIAIKNIQVTSSDSLSARDNKYYTDKYGENYYLVEMTEDFTDIMGTDGIYEGKYFRIEFVEDMFDAFGNPIYKEELTSQVKIARDVVSPKIADYKVLDLLDEEKVSVTTSGAMWFRMTEPVQLFNEDGSVSVVPAVTPGVDKDGNVNELKTPTFTYTKLAVGDEVATKVDGELRWVETLHDMEFEVVPTEELSEGDWILEITNISDDKVNNFDTVTYELTIKHETPTTPTIDPTEDNKIKPYILWTFALNDVKDASDASDTNIYDWVYIMYSRQMNNDVLKSATYDINGKQIEQGAEITSESVKLYRVNSNGSSDNYNTYYDEDSVYGGMIVKIKLPNTFLTGDDINYTKGTDAKYRKNLLTVPRSLKAKDDSEYDKKGETPEELQFDNNNDENQYELTFVSSKIEGIDSALVNTNDNNYSNYLLIVNQ